MTPRAAAIAALVVFALALGAVWWSLHTVRMERDAAIASACSVLTGQPATAVSTTLIALGMRDDTLDPRHRAYSTETSYFQGVACLVSVDPSGRITGTAVSRMRRQELWRPGSQIPIWGNVIWPALASASIVFTP